MFENAERFVRQGDKARDGRQWTAAREAYARAVQLDPSMDNIWVQYGHALKETGHLREAESAYRSALVIAPEISDTYLQLGHVLKLLGQRPEAATAYGKALELDPASKHAENELRFLALDPSIAPLVANLASSIGVELSKQLRCVILGTTGICNASCIHCPTGKSETGHVPRTPMPMALFEKIIRSLADGGYTIAVQMSFGLFGDGLLDPLVVERAKLLREVMPSVRLSVNTNGAAYNRDRHKPLIPHTSILALHVESLIPAVYDKLMTPLRAERVFPKIEQLLEDFQGKVVVSIPASRLNKEELPAMRQYFLDRGALYVSFDRLSNRCREDRTVFDELSLGIPHKTRCNCTALKDLIIDCDGKVLVCCNDFQRLEPVGELGKDSLVDVMASNRRLEIERMLDAGEWDSIKTCNNCYADGAVKY
jgi:MoaA/NifB/PqqE/SkfB family radical SAM enzyme